MPTSTTVTDEEFPIFEMSRGFVDPLVGSVRGLATGDFIVIWPVGSYPNLERSGMLFDSSGQPTGRDFLVAPSVASEPVFSTLSDLADGGFVSAWKGHWMTEDGEKQSAIRAQVFDPEGRKVGAEISINERADAITFLHSVTELANGQFVVNWAGYYQNGPRLEFSTLSQRFDRDGNILGPEFQLTRESDLPRGPGEISALSDGGYVAVWTLDERFPGREDSIQARIFDDNSQPIGPAFQVNTTSGTNLRFSGVTGLSECGFVATWFDYGEGEHGDGVVDARARVFDSHGVAIGGEVLAGTSFQDAQVSSSLDALPDGRFVLVWLGADHRRDVIPTDNSPESELHIQVFEADGSSIEREFLISAAADANLSQASVSALADGRFVVKWKFSDIQPGEPVPLVG